MKTSVEDSFKIVAVVVAFCVLLALISKETGREADIAKGMMAGIALQFAWTWLAYKSGVFHGD